MHVLAANRLRTLLVALSVALGAGAISLMVSLSKSGVATIAKSIEDVGGRRIIFLYSRDPKVVVNGGRYDKGITAADAVAIKERVPHLEDAAYFLNLKGETISGNGKKADVDLAIGGSFRFFMNQELELGTDVPTDADEELARVTVCTHQIATELFGSPEAAMGKTVVVFQHRYRIIGVAQSRSEEGFRMGGVSRTRTCFFPSQVMVKEEGVIDRGMMILKDDGTASHDYLMRVANAVLKERHRGVDDFEFFDFASLMGKFDAIFLGLRLLTGLIAGVSLFIAGAGIMNVLLASIRQRVREIGIRRALGASQSDIASQFLTESVLIGGLGGCIGSLAGIALTFAAGAIAAKVVPGWQTRVSIEAAVIAVVVAGVAGLIFGIQPARRAARLEVTGCLRGEA